MKDYFLAAGLSLLMIGAILAVLAVVFWMLVTFGSAAGAATCLAVLFLVYFHKALQFVRERRGSDNG